MNRPVPRLGALFRVRWRALVPAWLILVSGSWVADGLKGETLFREWQWVRALAEWSAAHGQLSWIDFRIAGLVFAVSCLAATSFWLYNYRRDFAQVRSLAQSPCSPHCSLVLLVSIPNPEPACSDGKIQIPDKKGGYVPLEGTLDRDIGRLTESDVHWNWQQLLRGIEPHLPGLKRVCLVGSGPDGSFGHLKTCDRILSKYLSHATAVKLHPHAVDFEDFNGLSRHLREIIREEKEAGRMRDEDIVVDITGGQKTTSIAGAGITLSTKVTFQYVQTRAPFKVHAYDVVQHFPTER